MEDLNLTAELMGSSDYKERFKAEYYQVAIRLKRLQQMLEKWDLGIMSFIPTCPRSIYDLQVRAMSDYKALLEARAVMENIKL